MPLQKKFKKIQKLEDFFETIYIFWEKPQKLSAVSPSHFKIIGTIFPWKNLKKSKFQFIIIIYDPKIDKKTIFRA
jgi:hypothetical protein